MNQWDEKQFQLFDWKCKNDPVYFINALGWTHDPRKATVGLAKLPFILYKRQEEMIRWFLKNLNAIIRGEPVYDLVVDKARDSGATWIFAALSVWAFKYYPELAIGWGSRKEVLVDNREDPKSIFFKIRYFLRNLPKRMRPKLQQREKDVLHMKLVNAENGASIVGESGDNIGRGGRTTFYITDEDAFLRNAESTNAALAENTDFNIAISTHNGTNTHYYYKTQNYLDKHKFTFEYYHCPWKTEEWFEKKKADYEKKGLEHKLYEEILRNPSASKIGTVINSIYLRSCIGAYEKLKINRSGVKKASFDVADGGNDKSAVSIKDANEIIFAKEYTSVDVADDTKKAIEIIDFNFCNYIIYDAVGVGAGVPGTVNATNANRVSKISIKPYKGSSKVIDPDIEYVEGLINKDLFRNLKAQSWWKLRVMVEKTYRAVEKGEEFNEDEIFSISPELENISELLNQLSQPTWKKSETGHIIIDKAPKGSKSPNLADSVVMLMAPKEAKSYSITQGW